jgi:hypothetical protein
MPYSKIPITSLFTGQRSVDLNDPLSPRRLSSLVRSIDFASPSVNALEHLVRIHAETHLLPSLLVAFQQSGKMLFDVCRSGLALPIAHTPLDQGAYWPLMPQRLFTLLQRHGWDGSWPSMNLAHIHPFLLVPFYRRLSASKGEHSHFYNASFDFEAMVLRQSVFSCSFDVPTATQPRAFDVWLRHLNRDLAKTSTWAHRGYMMNAPDVLTYLADVAPTLSDSNTLERCLPSVLLMSKPGSFFNPDLFFERLETRRAHLLLNQYASATSKPHYRTAL